MPPDAPAAVTPESAQILELVRLAVGRVASAPEDEQRYLELNFALDRAVERGIRYRDLLTLFEHGALEAEGEIAWAWNLAAGLTANHTGDAPAAIKGLEQAREEIADVGRLNTAAGSFLHGELARAYYHAGDHPAGAEAATRALQLARSANSLLAEAYARHYLGLISVRRRDYDYARRHLTAARELFELMNQRIGRARVLDSLAMLEMELGHYEPARQILHESLGVKEELRDLRGQALTCGNLVRLYAALGDYEQAMQYLDRQRELTSRVGDERNATLVRVQLGRLHLSHGSPELARVELLEARSLAQQRRDQRLEAFACFSLAEAEQQLGNLTAALEAVARAYEYFAASDDVVMRDRAAVRQALYASVPADAPEVQEPLDRLRRAQAGATLASALFEVATAAQTHDRIQEAAASYAEALDVAEPAQAAQLASVMRSRASSVEGQAWVDAMLTVKEQKDKLEHAYADLQRAEQLRDALTQMIVHDLKNPLAAITPWLQTIQTGALTTAETEEYLQTVIDECDYLLRMIEDLNDVGRMQHEGRLDLHLEPLDLPAMLRDVARRLQGRAREVGITIRLDEAAELPAVVGDHGKLRRVIDNLVTNAIKYGRPPEGTGRPAEVLISAQPEPAPPEGGRGSVRVTVCDYGVGIPPAEAERVFEAYYQAEAGRKRKAGVGLGLAYSRMVVDAHGGSIWTEPNPQGGTIFAFRLPAAGPEWSLVEA